MASTDIPEGWDQDGPVFVLVRPQMGENIGAAARAMWNFGLKRMRLVAPRDGWPNPRAVALASGAAGLLDHATVHATAAEATADCAEVYATTARPREITKEVLSPEAAAGRMRARVAAGQRVAVLMGPERTGLETEEVVLADVIVTADTNPAFGSINLAQASLLMAYEWRKSAEAASGPPPPEPRAPVAQVTGLLEHLHAELAAAGYYWPADKEPAMRRHLDNLFRRAPLTEHDVSTLRGAVRALAEGRRRARRKPAAQAEDMAEVRAGIDALDEALMALFAERRDFTERAAVIKPAAGPPAAIPARVEEVVANVRAHAAARGLDPDVFAAFWRQLIAAAIALEERRMGG